MGRFRNFVRVRVRKTILRTRTRARINSCAISELFEVCPRKVLSGYGYFLFSCSLTQYPGHALCGWPSIPPETHSSHVAHAETPARFDDSLCCVTVACPWHSVWLGCLQRFRFEAKIPLRLRWNSYAGAIVGRTKRFFVKRWRPLRWLGSSLCVSEYTIVPKTISRTRWRCLADPEKPYAEFLLPWSTLFSQNGRIFFAELVLTPRLKNYARAISMIGSPVCCLFGFIDGCKIQTCRMTQTPTSSFSDTQRTIYSGHKRMHRLDFQAVMSLDGLSIHFLGFLGRGPSRYYPVTQKWAASIPWQQGIVIWWDVNILRSRI